MSARGERWLHGLALAALTALAWVYLWQGAGMDMPASAMSAALLFPHRSPELAGAMQLGWPLVVAMWWVMMVAMMTPGALPLVLLYRRAMAHYGAGGPITTALLLLGYLLAWLGFSLLATGLQELLQPSTLWSASQWWSRSAWLSALLLAGAGAYQWSSWKQRCLTQCREPARFLSRHGRPGRIAALRLGLVHGAYCVGCCGPLMLLLFVGGVMNLVWVAALSALVLAEKLMPGGPWVARVSGAVLLVWAGVTLLV